MVVYLEVAFVENFVIDGVLLWLALTVAKVKPSIWRLLLAACVGAGEALLFPILPLPIWAVWFFKIAGGVLMVLIAVPSKRIKQYLIATAAFFALTFGLGGLLTAVYTFFGVEYTESGGYLIESAPVGLIVGGTAAFAISVYYAAKAFFRYRKEERNVLECVLHVGERKVHWRGFADSGNLLSYRGKPVCVTSPAAIFALFGGELKETGRIRIGTVNGMREAPVFECDRMEITMNAQTLAREHVFLTVGEVKDPCQLILNTALMEA